MFKNISIFVSGIVVALLSVTGVWYFGHYAILSPADQEYIMSQFMGMRQEFYQVLAELQKCKSSV